MEFTKSWQDDSESGATTGELLHSVKQELIEPTDIPPREMPEHKEVKENEDESQTKCIETIESKTREVEKAYTKNRYEEMSVEKKVYDGLTITPRITIKSAEALFEPEDCEEDITDEDPFPLADLTPCVPSTLRCIASSRKQIMQKSVSKVARDGNKWFNCTICTFSFTSKAKLMQHIESHKIPHKGPIGFYSLEVALQYSCEEHPKKHNKADENSNYSKSLMDEDDDLGSPIIMPYETEENQIIIEDEEEDEEKVHVKNPEDSLMKCEHCDTYFLDEEEFREHENVIHVQEAIKDKIPTKNSYCCDLCGKSSKNLVAFNTHLRSRHKAPPDNTCNVCGKSFPYSSRLKSHYLKHTGEKPCKCEFCGKCFGTNSHLNEHRRIHTGERRYKCMHCQNSYIQGSQLKAHLRSRHNKIKKQ